MSNKYKVGDQVIVRDVPPLFHTRTQGFTRGRKGVVVMLRPEWDIPEDEAWSREDRKETFYMVRFKLTDLWSDYDGSQIDTLETELSERWLDRA